MHVMNSSISSINQRAMTIEKSWLKSENLELNGKLQMLWTFETIS
jgi:hypothetical protein